MHAAIVCLVFWCCGAGLPDLARHDALEIRAVTPVSQTVARYGRCELRIDLGATYDNPFDPDDIDLYAEFVSPQGKKCRVNAFLDQACERRLENGGERIDPVGDPFWSVRFSPDAEGTWTYRVFARDRSGEASSPELQLTVSGSTSPGFVRRDTRSASLFAFDNGQPYFAIGENMGWGGPKGSYDYDEWLGALGGAGGNWIRHWQHRWSCCLEWTAADQLPWDIGTFAGLNVYNLCNAWKIDAVLDAAEKNGVYVMLCLGSYGELMTGGYFNEGVWATNPYNAANGGPCEKPEDFWTNEQARRLYRKRLRYVAARYGWRTHVFAWEFFNEAHPPTAWVEEMAGFLKGTGAFEGKAADPFGHLVSTTYGTPEIWALPGVDFTMTHHYGQGDLPDHTPIVRDDAAKHLSFGKPHLLAEFGIDWRSSDDKWDPQFRGINLHNGLWASALGGNAGTAMVWYWDSYVHPGKLYPQFTALRRFTDAIPWTEGSWKPLDIEPARVETDSPTYRDLTLLPAADWGQTTTKEYTVDALTGAGNEPLPLYLYGPSKPDLRTPLVFRVNFEQPGRFELTVNKVSSRATLVVTLDGAVARTVALSAVPPSEPGAAPEYESTELVERYNCYQATFNKRYGIDVPAGPHTIVLDVTDGDWLSTSAYVFGGYVSSRFADVDLCGIGNGTSAFLWAHNAAHNWLNAHNGTAVVPIGGAKTAVLGLPPGEYRCEWWDTWKGEITHRDTAVSRDGVLPLPLPELTTDAAVAIRPAAAPAM